MEFARAKELITKYERHVGVAAILFGFIFDLLTLARPDQLWENAIILGYLFIAAGGIFALTLYSRRGGVAPTMVLAIVQFAFGNLAGGFLVLYGKSGTFEGSFLFFLILGVFIVGNEFLRNHYARINFNIAVWYFLVLAYLALVVPILLGRFGVWVFLLSGLLSLLVAAGFLGLIYKVSSEAVISALRKTTLSIAAIFIVFNGLYFLNVLPPVPLSLREIGIYHSVIRTASGNYEVFYEKPKWYQFFRDTNGVFTLPASRVAYCFSSVFAPGRLTTGIYHHWESYNSVTKNWETVSRTSFSIAGGRDEGYRGYSQKSVSAGRWRCSVETERGALIGQTTFRVEEGTKITLTKGEL